MAIEEIKELDVDGVKVLVSDLSASQQRYVKVYQDTLQQKADAEDAIIGFNAALRALSNDLVVSIRADREKAAADVAAASEVVTDVVDAPTTPVADPAGDTSAA